MVDRPGSYNFQIQILGQRCLSLELIAFFVIWYQILSCYHSPASPASIPSPSPPSPRLSFIFSVEVPLLLL